MKKMNRPEVVKTSVSLPRMLWKRAHVRAMDEGRDLQDVIAAALEQYLGAPSRARTKEETR